MEDIKNENKTHHLSFPLYAASRAVIRRYNIELEKYNLTYTQYIALRVLWKAKTTNVKQLGQSLLLDSGTLSPILKKLENMGLVKRKRSARDERNLLITYTEKSLEIRDAVKDLPVQIASATGLTDAENRVIYGMLTKIIKNQI